MFIKSINFVVTHDKKRNETQNFGTLKKKRVNDCLVSYYNRSSIFLRYIARVEALGIYKISKAILVLLLVKCYEEIIFCSFFLSFPITPQPASYGPENNSLRQSFHFAGLVAEYPSPSSFISFLESGIVS